MGHISDINDRLKGWFRLAEYNFKNRWQRSVIKDQMFSTPVTYYKDWLNTHGDTWSCSMNAKISLHSRMQSTKARRQTLFGCENVRKQGLQAWQWKRISAKFRL